MTRKIVKRSTFLRFLNFCHHSFSFQKVEKRFINLLEHKSKQLLKENGLNIQDFYVVDLKGNIVGNKNLNATEYVIKAQISAGGRGKGHFLNGFKGGVHLTKKKNEIDNIVKNMIGQYLVTKQTTEKGLLVNYVMVAESVTVVAEKYLCILLDTAMNGPVFLASPVGGIDIESVAKNQPNSIRTYIIDINTGVTDEQCESIVTFLEFSDKKVAEVAKDQVKKLWHLFDKSDATQVEINPLVETDDKRVICVDAKITIDDNAKFRQLSLFQNNQEDVISNQDDYVAKIESEAKKANLNYVKMNGNIGCIVNGAGLAMATMDLITYFGGKAANFLDVGGGVTEEQVFKAFELLTKDPQVKVVLVNVFGGIVNCLTIAKGLLKAVRNLNIQLPLIVRLQGTNVDKAHDFLKDSHLDAVIVNDFNDAAEIAVSCAKQC